MLRAVTALLADQSSVGPACGELVHRAAGQGTLTTPKTTLFNKGWYRPLIVLWRCARGSRLPGRSTTDRLVHGLG